MKVILAACDSNMIVKEVIVLFQDNYSSIVAVAAVGSLDQRYKSYSEYSSG